MIEVTNNDIGRSVFFSSKYELETKGVITGFNEYWVFVRYTWQSYGSKGIPTKRESLRWENPDLSDITTNLKDQV